MNLLLVLLAASNGVLASLSDSQLRQATNSTCPPQVSYPHPTLPSPFDLKKRNAFVKRYAFIMACAILSERTRFRAGMGLN
jgi:hypothetical protein